MRRTSILVVNRRHQRRLGSTIHSEFPPIAVVRTALLCRKERWIASIQLDDTVYGTPTMRRTKASLIYWRTKNLRAVQLLLGHTKLEALGAISGLRFDNALEMAEQTEV